jgi:hypothetical protein
MKKTNLLIKLIAMALVCSFALFAFASCNSQETPSVDDGKDSESTDDKDTSIRDSIMKIINEKYSKL